MGEDIREFITRVLKSFEFPFLFPRLSQKEGHGKRSVGIWTGPL